MMLENIEFIIPCGGKSTRNYPHSKSIAHKSLLPFGDVRLIDVLLHDIIKMGGRHITIVCSNEETVKQFREALASDTVTEQKLRKAGRIAIADILASTFLPSDVDLKFAIQKEPLGTAHVLGLAHRLSPERHGVMIFPDDVILSKDSQNTHLQRIVQAFLSDESQILCTGIEKEDVSNNAIIHNGRLIEKPAIAYNHIGGYSPIVIPRQALDFMTAQVDVYEATGQMPQNLGTNEWVYTDGINQFLDSETAKGVLTWQLRMFMKAPEDLLLDTGTLPFYELALVRALLSLSRFRSENRALAQKLLAE